MIEKFLDYLRTEKQYSGHTVLSYRRDLQDFQEFLLKSEGHENLPEADRRMVRNFMAALSARGISKRSINRKLSALRGYYLFLLKIREIESSPMEGISSPKFYREKQVPFSAEEMEDFEELSAAEDFPALDRLVVEMLYQTGMRRAELCTLTLGSVDFEKPEMRVLGKGKKERNIPISSALAEQIHQYIEQDRPAVDGEERLFLTPKGKKLNEKAVYQIVTKQMAAVTQKAKKSPHILRHSFATHTLHGGAEISKIRQLMGHTSIASTQDYTHSDIEQLKAVFSGAHPRAKSSSGE